VNTKELNLELKRVDFGVMVLEKEDAPVMRDWAVTS
jgi:hypothetical protein